MLATYHIAGACQEVYIPAGEHSSAVDGVEDLARQVGGTDCLGKVVLARFAGVRTFVVAWVMLWRDLRPDFARHSSPCAPGRARGEVAGTARNQS